MNFFNAYALFYMLCFKICYNPCLLTYSWGKIFRNNLHFTIWFEYFDPVKVYVKVQPYLRTSRHKQIRIGAFQRGNISQLWSRGFKVTSLKCWQSRKKWDTLDSRHIFRKFIHWISALQATWAGFPDGTKCLYFCRQLACIELC